MDYNKFSILFFAKNKPGTKESLEYLKKYFNNIRIYTGEIKDPFPEDTLSFSPDIIISYISPWIIPKQLLNNTKILAVNFHPGPPEYPGIGCTNFAIYNGEKYFGATAHVMEEKVDSGKILTVEKFPIYKNDSVYSITEKCYQAIQKLFKKVIDEIVYNRLHYTNIKWKRKPYTRKELEDLCKIDANMDREEVARRIRATKYPGMPGAYIELYGFKFEYNEKR